MNAKAKQQATSKTSQSPVAFRKLNGDLRDFPLCGYTPNGKPVVLMNQFYKHITQEAGPVKRVVIKKDLRSGKQFIRANGKQIEFAPLKVSDLKNVITKDSKRPDVKVKQLQRQQPGQAAVKSLPSSQHANGANVIIKPSNPADSILKKPLALYQKRLTLGKTFRDNWTSTEDLHKCIASACQTDSKTLLSQHCQTESDLMPISMPMPMPSARSVSASPYPHDLVDYLLADDTTLIDLIETPITFTPAVNNTKDTNNRAIKMKFLKDLHDCIKYDISGNLPIHIAVLKNSVTDVKRQCLLLSVRQININIMNNNNLTPLQLAVMLNVDPQIMVILVDNGADISLINSDGNSLIHLAVLNCQEDVALSYLVHVATQRKFDINLFNYEGCTPLIICASTNKLEMAKILLEKGADPNIKDKKSGRTALFHAVENNDEKMVYTLMTFGADPKVRNFFGTSPHDAMYELDNINKTIKLYILGKDLTINRIKQAERKKRKLDGEPSNETSEWPPNNATIQSIVVINPGMNPYRAKVNMPMTQTYQRTGL